MLQICQEMTGYNANLDLVSINAYTNFGQILSIISKDIERKRNSDVSQWPYLRLFEMRKMTSSNPYLEHVNINAYTNFGKILPISSQDIERKRKSVINQGAFLCYKVAKNDV